MPIPANLTAGDSANWNDDPFTSGDGTSQNSSRYTLTYELRGPSSPVTLTGVAAGQGWKTTLTAATSAGMSAGLWFWAAILTASGERITAARGELNVAADIAGAGTGYDGRSLAEKSLADAESALANLTSSGKRMKKYTIGSRQAEYFTAAELLEAISYWRVRVQNERAAKSISDGLGNPKNLMVRFR